MRLSQCRPGQGGKIVRVDGDGMLGQRLMEMGLIEGVEVKVLRVAPLGDPLEIEVQSYQLSLRKSEAERIELE